MAQLMNAKQPLPNPYPELEKFIARLPIKPKQRPWEAPKSGLSSRFGLLPVI